MSFQIIISPSRRAATRFIGDVRRALQGVLFQEQKKTGLTQSGIAKSLGVHRSIISRELNGFRDMTLGRIAELAYCMGRTAIISFPESEYFGENEPGNNCYSENSTNSDCLVVSTPVVVGSANYSNVDISFPNCQ